MASDPIWATLFAGLLGAQEQDLGTLGVLGGILVVAGAALAGSHGGGSPRAPRQPGEDD